MLPIERIRELVKEKLSVNDSDINSLAEFIMLKTMPYNNSYGYAEVKEIILDMVESGRIIEENNILSTNKYFVETFQHSIPYTNVIELKNSKRIDGNVKATSLHSEDFYFNFEDLKEGKNIIIELVPEIKNEYDGNAVAIMYNNKVLGYMQRRHSKEYQSYIQKLNQEGFKAETEANIVLASGIGDFLYLTFTITEI